MSNHPHRNKKQVYFYDGTKRFNNYTGFHERIATRSDGKEVVLSAKRMKELRQQERLVLP